MSDQSSLLERLKASRAVQALIVYVGAAYIVLEVVETLTSMLSLPDWLGPVTVVLLGVGLLVVAATAWVQSLDSTTAAEKAGERPTDWEVAPADALARLKAGKLPQLTWARAIVGGVVAISLAIGVAGGYVLVTGGSGLIGHAEVGAGEVAAGIAVVPFTISGEGYDQYREGMVDLLSQNLDGVGGYRTIDNRTVLARWAEVVGDEAAPDLDMSLRAAGQTGARYAMVGGLTAAGSQIRLSVDIYDLESADEIGSAQAEGDPDDILTLVDQLSVALARELLGESADAVGSTGRIASITTGSLEALEAFLEGEQLIRRGQFVAAIEPLQRAVAIDSTFALAHARLGGAAAWASQGGVSTSAREAAGRHIDRLSAREAILVRTRLMYAHDDPAGFPILQQFVRQYPDEAEGYYQLAEYPYHRAHLVSVPRNQLLGWLMTAAELDPGFTPYQIHLVEMGLATGDSTFTRNWIERFEELGGAEGPLAAWDRAFGSVFRRETDLGPSPNASAGFGPFASVTLRTDFPARELQFLVGAGIDPGPPAAIALLRAGKIGEYSDLLAGTSAVLGQFPAHNVDPYGLIPDELLHDVLAEGQCGLAFSCTRWEATRAIHAARSGHTAELAEALAAQRAAADNVGDAASEVVRTGSGSSGIVGNAVAAELEITRAHVAFHQGRPEEALQILSRLRGTTHVDLHLMARAAEATGDLALAEELYLGQSWQFMGPAATLDLARLYERTNRPEQALRQWQRFLVMWEEADEGLAPLDEAREAVARLGG